MNMSKLSCPTCDTCPLPQLQQLLRQEVMHLQSQAQLNRLSLSDSSTILRDVLAIFPADKECTECTYNVIINT